MTRPPIVTILGHVDHGKTTLLDYIRKSSLAKKELGGITQRIGAYEISTGIQGYETDKITFIDTPGHEAFSQLRSRGATVADIALLIVDAKDSIMPQTIESIAHIKNAGIPYIVVINKVDLEEAKPDKVKRDLLKHEVITEEKGGEVIAVSISAKTGLGVPELLEAILLLASDQKLTFDIKNPVAAFIIETKKEIRGITVSAVIKDGQISVGDEVYANKQKIKIRSLLDDTGKPVKKVIPSTPFEILGFSELPEVGTLITSVAETEEEDLKEDIQTDYAPPSFEDIFGAKEKPKKLPLVVKAESQGSLEAIIQALKKNENIEIVMSALGSIHRSDIFLAKSAKAIVTGFSVAVDNEVKHLAKQEKVIIKTYDLIYELLEELQEVSDLLHEKEQEEKHLKAQAKILAVFVIDGQTYYGARVNKGKVNVGDNAEVYRKVVLSGKSKLVSLRIRAKIVSEVKKDQECGLQFEPKLDIKVGDMVKFIL